MQPSGANQFLCLEARSALTNDKVNNLFVKRIVMGVSYWLLAVGPVFYFLLWFCIVGISKLFRFLSTCLLPFLSSFPLFSLFFVFRIFSFVHKPKLT